MHIRQVHRVPHRDINKLSGGSNILGKAMDLLALHFNEQYIMPWRYWKQVFRATLWSHILKYHDMLGKFIMCHSISAFSDAKGGA